MNASTNLYVFEDHKNCLGEGITTTTRSKGSTSGNMVAHNKFGKARNKALHYEK
jgi:hypothetical protein